MAKLPIYLEVAAKRTFAGAVDWPGWERSGRDEAAAIEAFVGHGERYRRALGRAAADMDLPRSADDVTVVERRDGGSGTEFGVPSYGASADDQPVDDDELRRLTAILEAAWQAFDAAAQKALRSGVELRKGPRGGGRDVPKLIEHVLGGEQAYVSRIGGEVERGAGSEMDRVRAAALVALRARAANEPFEMGRRTAPLWTPRYFVRRSAWHALDHAWEIEDRSAPQPG
jgi:hypothetical protein